jgi:trimeric autotransporter adhesin
VDSSGNVYVAGESRLCTYDGFVTRLDNSGNLTWNIYLGGSGNDVANAIAVDGSGDVYVAGEGGYPWGSPVQSHTGGGGAFAAKFSPDPAPEIEVQGNGVEICSGDTTPDTADHTDFGSVNVNGGTQVRTFTIQNTGHAALAVSTPTITGDHAADFTLSSAPASSVADGDSATFQITFDPSALGTRTATISIANDDISENPYTFAIQGVGLAPKIDVQGNGISISSGDITPDLADHTDFGSANATGDTVVRTFTIHNTGDGDLTLSGPNAGDFSLSSAPASNVAAGDSTTFQITFDPSAGGARMATISIANDGLDENPYIFAIQGEGLVNHQEV